MSFSRIALIVPLAFIATSCAHKEKVQEAQPVVVAAPTAPMVTQATLAPGAKSKVQGTVRFERDGDNLTVLAEVTGLKPRSKHGFHIHENGECAAPKFETAGGHYNPAQVAHGGTGTPQRHPGDLGNLVADRKGKATLKLSIAQSPSNDSFVGRSVVVHAKADDMKTQPSGDSGDRIACGVIAAAPVTVE